MWWQTLGVPSDADLKQVKRAYAQLIKEYRPDTHPAEFGEIRQAFEQARYLIQQEKANQEEGGAAIKTDNGYDFRVEAAEPELTASDINSEQNLNGLQSPITDEKEVNSEPQHVFLDEKTTSDDMQAEAQYHQNRLIDAAKLVDEYGALVFEWKARGFDDEFLKQILQHEALNQFESFQDVSEKLFSFLVDNINLAEGAFTTSLNIPYHSLAQLDEVFGWSRNEVGWLQKYEYNDENASLVFYGITEGYKKPGKRKKTWAPTKKYFLYFIRVVGYLVAFTLMASNPIGRIILVIWLAILAYKGIARLLKKRSKKSG